MNKSKITDQTDDILPYEDRFPYNVEPAKRLRESTGNSLTDEILAFPD